MGGVRQFSERPGYVNWVETRAKGEAAPIGFDVGSCFRPRLRRGAGGGHVSRCQMPIAICVMQKLVTDALSAMLSLVTQLIQETELLFDAVGVNPDIRALLNDSALCWDWGRLALRRASVDDLRAFQRVAVTLRPCFANTNYPSAETFRKVAHTWPPIAVLRRQFSLGE